VLLNGSSAVTVRLNAVPAVAVLGALTAKCVAGEVLMVMALEVPVIEAFAVSMAVMVCVPAVFSVAENVPVPPLSVLSAGKTASVSLLVK
jgi:hypothetical protein